ncbi:MAG TPA: hypothetical protein VL978_08575 [Puia sp.]|nr:hypothetical protein [Puia sp.]
MATSFFDLDFIIEINQQRLEQYNTSLQKVLERLTNIILIYSALGIFLVSIIQDMFGDEIHHFIFYVGFFIFSIFLIFSLVYFIKLLLPVEIAYLDPPHKYYQDFMIEMQEKYPGDDKKVDNSLKGSYILELENAISVNFSVFRRKSSFYYNALLFALLAVIPYITCVAFHLSKKDDKIQKVQLINPKKS